MFAQLNFPGKLPCTAVANTFILSFSLASLVEYLGVVRDSLATTGPECNKNIKEATAQIEGLLKTKDGRQQLKKDFRYWFRLPLLNSHMWTSPEDELL